MTVCVNCAKFRGCNLSSPNVNECADYKEILTNEEWFCNLSTEEKAKMLGRVSFCDFCPHQLSEHCAWTTGYSEDCVYGNKENEELWLKWLKEIHE